MRNWLKRLFSADAYAIYDPTPPKKQTPITSKKTTETVDAIKARGNNLLNAGVLTDALTCFRQAIAISPDDVDALISLGVVLIHLNLYSEAEIHLTQAALLAPQNFDTYYLLGCISKTQGNLTLAKEHYKKALAREKNFDICRGDLCYVLFQTGEFEEAKSLMLEGISLNPSFPDFHQYLGNLYFYEESLDKAFNCYQNALTIQPDNADVYNNLGGIFRDQGEIDSALECHHKAVSLDVESSEKFGNMLFTLNYHPDKSATEIFSAYQDFDARFGLPFRSTWQSHANDRQPNRRLKIGYVSPDFRHHSTRHFLEPLLEHHDKMAVEIYAYAYAEQALVDKTTERYRSYVDHWVQTQNLTAEAMTERIRKDEIDILVDLAGHTAHNRLDVFARKPAPISVSWLGFGYTTGLTAIDYFLTDETSAPVGCEVLFSETPWRLKTPGAAYRPAAGMGDVSTLPALQRGYVTLCSLTRAIRINHRTIRVWSAILKRLESARLVIDSRNFESDTARESLENRFAAQGIGGERLEIGCHSPPWDVLRKVDIGLDCFPHNSGTTLVESLYMGVPFVTLAGRPSVGRIGSSILKGVELSEWIAYSEDEYVEKVVDLASNHIKLAEIRSRLRSKVEASPLMDEAGFALKVEAAYREMFKKWCDKTS